MSISRFPLRDKVTLRLLKLYLYGADVVEWSTALDQGLALVFAIYQWSAFISRREKNNI